MQLNETIINKYNGLFREVTKYYGIDKQSLEIIPSMGLLHPCSFNWDVSISHKIDDNMELLEKNYPYLTPFYKIFISMFSRKYRYMYIEEETFNAINRIIKKIRKEKLERT